MTRFRVRWRLAAVVVLPIFLMACGDDPVGPGEEDTIIGSWEGTVSSAGEEVPVSIAFRYNAANRLVGEGEVEVGGVVSAFEIVDGDYFHPLVTATLIFDRPPPGQLSGNVSAARDVITGTLNGPGFGGEVELRLERVARY